MWRAPERGCAATRVTPPSIDSSDKVNGALRDFLDKWDERRGDLADTLEGVEEALGAIHDSFTATEDELVAQLNGESP